MFLFGVAGIVLNATCLQMRLGALRMDGEVPTTPKEALTGTTRKSDRKMAVQDKVMVIDLGRSLPMASAQILQILGVPQNV